jgi:hypothetical protein
MKIEKPPLKEAAKPEFVARAERAMKRAGEKAREDYRRFGLTPPKWSEPETDRK